MDDLYLGFDLGAGSGRAMLGSLDDEDRLRVSEVHRFPNEMIESRGHLHWDTPRLLEEVLGGMQTCAKRFGSLSSVGVDSWGVDYALLNKEGALIDLPYSYRDRRTEGAAEEFLSRMPLETLYNLTGTQVLPFNTLFQLHSMVRDHDSTLRSASSLLLIADLFNYHLTGVRASEFTLATTTHMFNPRTYGWEEELVQLLNLPPNLLQGIIQPGTRIGELKEEVKEKTGLGRVPVVAVACHDTGSAVAAVPAEDENFAYISSGTWSLMGIESREPIINKKILGYNLTNEGGVAGTFRVLRNIAGLWFLQECRREWENERSYTYPELIELAEGAEPLRSIINPDWYGFLNPPSMTKAIASYCTETEQPTPSTIGEFTRTILESLALAYRHTLGSLEDVAGKRLNKIHVVGGGSQNGLLCKLTADAAGRTVHAGPAEATAVGNILVQAMAGGRVKSMMRLRETVRNSFTIVQYEPRQSLDWDSAYNRFTELKERSVEEHRR